MVGRLGRDMGQNSQATGRSVRRVTCVQTFARRIATLANCSPRRRHCADDTLRFVQPGLQGPGKTAQGHQRHGGGHPLDQQRQDVGRHLIHFYEDDRTALGGDSPLPAGRRCPAGTHAHGPTQHRTVQFGRSRPHLAGPDRRDRAQATARWRVSAGERHVDGDVG